MAYRFLQTLDNSTDPSNSTTAIPSLVPSLQPSASPTTIAENVASVQEGQVLRDTLVVYGSILVIVTLLFCWVRLKFPRPYTVRSWTTNPELKTSLADDQYGFFSWMWKLCTGITEDELLEECGMDALCFLRAISMGYRICLVGILNAAFLIPLYATAESSVETDLITDPIQRISISHVPAESMRFIGTVVAAYILFGWTMYLVLQEFEWFIEMRHKFLRKPVPRNYTVYVRNIPPEYRSNAGLEEFFRLCFSAANVLEARVKVKTPALTKVVQERSSVVNNLETALAIKQIKGIEPTHRESLVGGEKQNSIETYVEQLNHLNDDITRRIETIEQKTSSGDTNVSSQMDEESVSRLDEDSVSLLSVSATQDTGALSKPRQPPLSETDKDDTEQSSSSQAIAKSFQVISAGANKLASQAVSMVKGGEDGTYYSGGFVSFANLSTTNAARQMVHFATPFQLEVAQAPDPNDIFWFNVGREHKDLQLGNLFSKAATTVLCLFWTIPMAFISSLSSVEGLKKQVDWIARAIEAFPFLEPLLQQLAPLLIIVVNELLAVILEHFSMLEGPVSGSVVAASTFAKMAAFTIIQTFFVTTFSGTIMDELWLLVNDPLSVVDLLANSLPGQSTFFIQLSFIGTVTFIAMENLRVSALVMAFLRRFIGPRLTEKQRQTTFMGIRPLADPPEFQYDDNMSQICVLYFMIVLVYQTIAPITSFFLGFCFLILRPFCLHQMIYIYPTRPDSGGKIWTSFIGILLACMVIAELTILGLMGLKKSAIATTLMIPLVIITMLFNGYVRQEHFRVAEFLPSKECFKVDRKNETADFDLDFVKGQYLQEELREKVAYPEGLSKEEIRSLGLKNDDVEEAGFEEGGGGEGPIVHDTDAESRSFISSLFRK